MKKFIAYYRVSTTKQNLGLSAQKKMVNDYINSNPDNHLICEFEEKESGKSDNRIELNKALIQCKKENATLIIAKLDRLSRKVSFLFNLKESNIDFIALDIPQFTTLTLGIFATLAQSERETISSRTKAALAIKKQYMKLGAPNAHFTKEQIQRASEVRKEIADNNINNKRAKITIQSLLKQTQNKAEIARILNENGFTTSRGHKFNSKGDCKLKCVK